MLYLCVAQVLWLTELVFKLEQVQIQSLNSLLLSIVGSGGCGAVCCRVGVEGGRVCFLSASTRMNQIPQKIKDKTLNCVLIRQNVKI